MDTQTDNAEHEMNYDEGDFVVYPAHDVGQVLGMEKV